jgi:hypothetical protein
MEHGNGTGNVASPHFDLCELPQVNANFDRVLAIFLLGPLNQPGS